MCRLSKRGAWMQRHTDKQAAARGGTSARNWLEHGFVAPPPNLFWKHRVNCCCCSVSRVSTRPMTVAQHFSCGAIAVHRLDRLDGQYHRKPRAGWLSAHTLAGIRSANGEGTLGRLSTRQCLPHRSPLGGCTVEGSANGVPLPSPRMCKHAGYMQAPWPIRPKLNNSRPIAVNASASHVASG